MNISAIILQVPTTDVSGTGTDYKLIIFWLAVAFCVALFFYFLRRTDRLINERAALENPVEQPDTSHLHGGDVHDEEAAAIALAIHMYKSELHDRESFTITLQKVSRIYSPWSSKIYTLRQNPRR